MRGAQLKHNFMLIILHNGGLKYRFLERKSYYMIYDTELNCTALFVNLSFESRHQPTNSTEQNYTLIVAQLVNKFPNSYKT